MVEAIKRKDSGDSEKLEKCVCYCEQDVCLGNCCVVQGSTAVPAAEVLDPT